MVAIKGFNKISAVILLVEDNEGEARLVMEALKGGSLRVELRHVRDGVEAMQFLNHEGRFKDALRPDLILLDLNMPRMDGREVLDKIRQQNNLSSIPVIVLTTSRSEADVIQSYRLQANCYIPKPVDFDTLTEVMNHIKQFWFNVASLPHTDTTMEMNIKRSSCSMG